jgi:hypothetical protein
LRIKILARLQQGLYLVSLYTGSAAVCNFQTFEIAEQGTADLSSMSSRALELKKEAITDRCASFGANVDLHSPRY